MGEMVGGVEEGGQPDIAVPAEFDQFFICGFVLVASKVTGQ